MKTTIRKKFEVWPFSNSNQTNEFVRICNVVRLDFWTWISYFGFRFKVWIENKKVKKIKCKKIPLPGGATVWNLIFPQCDVLLQLLLFSWHWVTSLLMRIEPATAWGDLKRKLSSFKKFSSFKKCSEARLVPDKMQWNFVLNRKQQNLISDPTKYLPYQMQNNLVLDWDTNM